MPEARLISNNMDSHQESDENYVVQINDHPVILTEAQHRKWKEQEEQKVLQGTEWSRITVPTQEGLYEGYDVKWDTVKKILNKAIFMDAVPDPEKELFKKIEEYTERLSDDLINSKKPNEIVKSLRAFWRLAYKVALDEDTLKTKKKLGTLNDIKELKIRREKQLKIIETCLKKLGIMEKVLQDFANEQILFNRQNIFKTVGTVRNAIGSL